ncbi:hypothetical protein BH10BAC4_BH10BAC4_17800 [soil metagenome]
MKLKVFLFLVAAVAWPAFRTTAQSVYTTNTGHISFFSKAPIKDVDAQNEKARIGLNVSSGELTIDMAMKDFKFKSGKMGRDAQKSYLETDKFKVASFKGKIKGDVDYHKAGTYQTTVTGKLKIHGVEKEVTEKGTVTVNAGKITLKSEFHVQLKDYNVETPKILGKEMAGESVLVTVSTVLSGPEKKISSKK